MSLLVFLTFFKYEATLYNLLSSRFQVVADDIENTISKGLSLGADLPELKTTEQVIFDVKSKDDQILSIQVFQKLGDLQGITLFNTRQAGIGGQVPREWMTLISTFDPNSPWQFRTESANVVGTNIIDKLGKSTGGVAVRFSQEYMDQKKQDMLNLFVYDALRVFIITCAVIILASYLFFRRISISFISMRDSIDELLQHGKLQPSSQPKSDFEGDFAQVLTNASQVIKDLEAIDKQLSKGKTTSAPKKGAKPKNSKRGKK